MDVSLSETQQLLRDAIRDYLHNEVPYDRVREVERSGSYDRPLWDYLQQAGYLGLPFAAELGGDGGELTDLAVLLEELTRRAVVLPFMESMAAALAVARAGDQTVARDIVTGLTGGTMTLSPAVLEASDRFDDIQASVQNGTLTGEKLFVDYGQVVTHHLVAAKENGEVGLYLVDANAPQVTAHPLRTIADLPQATIKYDGVAARKAGGAQAYAELLRLARALNAVQCLGNAQAALDITVEYVSMRVQFGRPIGTFQAVQHHVANMATMVEAARFLVYEAVWLLGRGELSDGRLAIAQAQASRAATEVPMLCHQLHGGIGITAEYDLHFFSLRGKERSVAWGSTEENLRMIAAGLEERESWL